jgi:hypothetical protein
MEIGDLVMSNNFSSNQRRLTALIEAIRSYQQADEDGVMVLVSRQACDEAATEIERLLELNVFQSNNGDPTNDTTYE